MIFVEAQELFKRELSAVYDDSEIQTAFNWVLEHLTKLSPIELRLTFDKQQFTEFQEKQFIQIIEELKSHKPLQYALGEATFYGLNFKVNENVLIPRPETEELVDWILQENTLQSPTILDVGTGSGCIAISLKKNIPNAKVFALDISEKALELAQENARHNQTEIHFLHRDILNNTLEDVSQFDIIVSNPPYIRDLEKKMMQANVLEYEPHLALFVSNENPLIFYDRISSLAQEKLQKNGILFFEINQYLGMEMQNLLQKKSFSEIEIRKDLNQNERMLKSKYDISH